MATNPINANDDYMLSPVVAASENRKLPGGGSIPPTIHSTIQDDHTLFLPEQALP